jgi:hypothetical protein
MESFFKRFALLPIPSHAKVTFPNLVIIRMIFSARKYTQYYAILIAILLTMYSTITFIRHFIQLPKTLLTTIIIQVFTRR